MIEINNIFISLNYYKFSSLQLERCQISFSIQLVHILGQP